MAARERQREHRADSSGFHHRTDGLIKVHTRSLGEAAEDPTCLVPLEGAIRLKFVLEDPLPSDNIGLGADGAQDLRCGSGEEHCVLP